ncbi:uncharacterized protein A4U43_C04F1690 [Asparagus officinalis]|uniref:DUF3444 domain-containing protein n=1 Tax=Asparagus officinalis TaxID=4686 RepID=A0A5P1EXZ8_ASPOF|nr:uncharacterized protein LOC109836331 [Asparagus officinalis]ONK70802.1 uncharacterized protein A4U43_C04F1690 [Asparagus officinalis]
MAKKGPQGCSSPRLGGRSHCRKHCRKSKTEIIVPRIKIQEEEKKKKSSSRIGIIEAPRTKTEKKNNDKNIEIKVPRIKIEKEKTEAPKINADKKKRKEPSLPAKRNGVLISKPSGSKKRRTMEEINAGVRRENAGKVEDERAVIRVTEIGQIWAFPNSSDGGFPRSYARIDRIIPIPSPTVEATLLVPETILEEEKQFAEHGLSLSCGKFKSFGKTITKDIDLFTHEVKCEVEEGEGSCFYRIFPRKGEVWAVYWDSEYKLVEIASDFSEEDGVNVFGLIKVEGLNGVYQRQLHEGFYLIRCFSRRFMPMFSHRVLATKIEESVEMRWKVMFH